MQSQIAFVPRRPQLVSVAEFDDEPSCLFARVETATRRQITKCLYRVIARDFDDQSAMRIPRIFRWNTISALPLELERSGSSAKRRTNLPGAGATNAEP
jgi:hypothetical protein